MYLGEDSYFLSEELKKYLKGKNKGISILDLGSGTGIQAETCINLGFTNVLAADIDKEAVENLKNKKISARNSDLFEKIKKEEKFDLIIFNPPYLPESKFDKEKDTSGGKRGDETIIKSLENAKEHLKENGKILLLLSSFTPKNKVNKLIEKQYKKKILAEKKLFFEKLEIWEISI